MNRSTASTVEAVDACGKHRQQNDHHRGVADHCHPHHPVQAEALGQQAGQLRHADEGYRVDREEHAVDRRRQAVMVDQNEGRIGEIDEEAGNAEAADEGQPRKLRSPSRKR
jgi:hypothetical protein